MKEREKKNPPGEGEGERCGQAPERAPLGKMGSIGMREREREREVGRERERDVSF